MVLEAGVNRIYGGVLVGPSYIPDRNILSITGVNSSSIYSAESKAGQRLSGEQLFNTFAHKDDSAIHDAHKEITNLFLNRFNDLSVAVKELKEQIRRNQILTENKSGYEENPSKLSFIDLKVSLRNYSVQPEIIDEAISDIANICKELDSKTNISQFLNDERFEFIKQIKEKITDVLKNNDEDLTIDSFKGARLEGLEALDNLLDEGKSSGLLTMLSFPVNDSSMNQKSQSLKELQQKVLAFNIERALENINDTKQGRVTLHNLSLDQAKANIVNLGDKLFSDNSDLEVLQMKEACSVLKLKNQSLIQRFEDKYREYKN
ncbi:MAG: hypothetical protein HRT47_12365 [Candidatus Caenarcaniphilales bacterium]|nr:hypothetical protein [Candidatus Caenarcaniphilales bacterium]